MRRPRTVTFPMLDCSTDSRVREGNRRFEDGEKPGLLAGLFFSRAAAIRRRIRPGYLNEEAPETGGLGASSGSVWGEPNNDGGGKTPSLETDNTSFIQGNPLHMNFLS